MLQTLGSDESYSSSERLVGSDSGPILDVEHYFGIFKRRFFYFLLPFGIVSVLGLFVSALQKPNYLSEAKVLLEAQGIAPDIVRPVITGSGAERVQLIQQRVTTRDTLRSIANKFGLFRGQSDAVDLMRKSLQITPIDLEAGARQGTGSIAFTVGFEYENPELAMRVANEFVTMIVGEDVRSRTTQATEAVRILTEDAKSVEDKLASIQAQMEEIARRPRDATPEIPEQQKSDMAALAALKAELTQKSAVYSDAHPAVIALKKRIAATEKSLTHPTSPSAQHQSTPDEIESLRRQREALEKQFADANNKLASARLSENQEQRSERMQVIEAPSLPQRPVKANRLKLVGIFFAGAAMLGIGSALGVELLDGSIRNHHQLSKVVNSSLVICIPYIATNADILRTRLKIFIGVCCVMVLLAAWAGLIAAIFLNVPLDVGKWF